MVLSNRLRLVAAGITAVLAVGLAGCGGSDESNTTPAPAAPAAGSANGGHVHQTRKPMKAGANGALQAQ